MEHVTGGVCAPEGFQAAGCAAEIKYKNRRDMAMLYSERPCTAAGVFTKNVVKAAPVLWDRDIIKKGDPVHAVVVNAGVANACTGEQGKRDCAETASEAAKLLSLRPEQVLVASTGVIGMHLPMERIRSGIQTLKPLLAASEQAADAAAKAIITTDTHQKEQAVAFTVDGKTCHIGAMAKGSGMIHPNMGTMLCFLTTDVSISHDMLQKALLVVTQDTFNMISVDGDTSTNDTALLLANGAAGNTEITEENESYHAFLEALLEVCSGMSKMLAGDGEGATALFEVSVAGVPDKESARTLARSVICSSLTKAAIFGHDANWGRILCALGYAGVAFDPDRVTLVIKSDAGSILLFENGAPVSYSEEEATQVLSQPVVRAEVDLHAGDCEATAWGCDLSYDYVKINADYRS